MPTLRHLFVEGSSTSDPVSDGTTKYHVTYLNHTIADTDSTVYATGGATLSTFQSRQSTITAAFSSTGLNILTLQIGQNDLITGGTYQGNESGWQTDVQTYIAGFYSAAAAARKHLSVGVCTMNPRADTNFNSSRAIINPVMRGWVGSIVDFCIDWAADTTYGSQDSFASDTSKYPDGVHPSQANQDNMEALYYRPSCNGVLLPAGIVVWGKF